MFYVWDDPTKYYSGIDDGNLHDVNDYPELVGSGNFFLTNETFYTKSSGEYKRKEVSINPRYGSIIFHF